MRTNLTLAKIALVFVFTTSWGLAASSAELYFPPASGEWERIAPGDAGWDAAALDAALEYAGKAHSSGVVILLNGRILAERIWKVTGSERYDRMHSADAADGHAIEDIASGQKSVVAFLAGVAERKGQLDLDAPVEKYVGKGWSKAEPDAESKITVKHLMTMTSGLNDALVYQQPAGKVWRYNTGAYSRMIGVLEKSTNVEINAFTRDSLTAPLGMNDSKWAPRPWAAGNDAANSVGFATTARDLARFGLLILAEGKWNGKDLLQNPGYLKRMLSSSQDLNPSYGLLWWINGQKRVLSAAASAKATEGSMIPAAPGDLVAAQGALDRKCYVVPSMGLVVTRLGDAAGETFNQEFWTLLMKAAPKTGN